MKTEIRKILADKTETLEDGRVVIVPDFSQLDDLVDDLDTLFSLHFVSQRSELFKSFLQKVVQETEVGDLTWQTRDEAKELLKLLNCG